MKTAIVLGVRSGTSMTSGILANLGVSMGDVWLGPNEHNPKGYFEDAHFLSLVNRIHSAHSGSKMIPAVLKDKSKIPQSILEEFKAVVDTHKKDVWGFKAPGYCYLLDALEEYLPDPHYIVCYRNPIEIASSSHKVHEHIVPEWFPWFEYAKGFMNTCMKETTGRNRTVLHFHETIDNPQQAVEQIMEFLGITPSEEQIQNAIKFVDPTLKHNEVNI